MENHDAIKNLLERIARLHMNAAFADGLKPVQWEVLCYLDRANRFSRSPTAIRTYLGITKGTVSQTIIALEKRGYLEKSHAGSDKRAVFLNLTEAGRSLVTDHAPTPLEAAVKAMPYMATEATRRTLESILATALSHTDGKPFGSCKACRHFDKTQATGVGYRCSLFDAAIAEQEADQICREYARA